jgi:hypothetical protein
VKRERERDAILYNDQKKNIYRKKRQETKKKHKITQTNTKETY